MSLVTLDLEFTRTNLDDDFALMHALMQIAVEDLPIYAIELQSALERNETDKLRRLAHAMKGLAANFRAEPLTKLTSQLEREPYSRDPLILRQLVEEVSTTCEGTVRALVSELSHVDRANVSRML